MVDFNRFAKYLANGIAKVHFAVQFVALYLEPSVSDAHIIFILFFEAKDSVDDVLTMRTLVDVIVEGSRQVDVTNINVHLLFIGALSESMLVIFTRFTISGNNT